MRQQGLLGALLGSVTAKEQGVKAARFAPPIPIAMLHGHVQTSPCLATALSYLTEGISHNSEGNVHVATVNPKA